MRFSSSEKNESEREEMTTLQQRRDEEIEEEEKKTERINQNKPHKSDLTISIHKKKKDEVSLDFNNDLLRD